MIDATTVKGYNAYELRRMIDADIKDPPSLKAPGGVFLTDIASSYADNRERYFNLSDEMAVNEEIDDAADAAIPVNEYERWEIFTDLELFGDTGLVDDGPFTWENINQAATSALDTVARLLIRALIAADEEAVFDGAMGDDDE